MKQAIKTYIVDSFTNEIFKGNPAGVCILKQELEENEMLNIAKELGLSETAFIQQLEESHKYSIRYFSPKMEIPLCGHATLASAKVLFERMAQLNKIHFLTIQNLDLWIEREGAQIKMEFPVYETREAKAPKELLHALGLKTILNTVYNEETKILLLEINSSQVLKNLKPDFAALYQSHQGINGVLVTAESDREHYDFESRYFWPWSGTNEDPVTGGTHTFLAKYWSERLNKSKMKSFQCSDRTGYMEVDLISDHKLYIKSHARIVLRGELDLF
jgi:PhzF family phenazine biosynthesis protein